MKSTKQSKSNGSNASGKKKRTTNNSTKSSNTSVSKKQKKQIPKKTTKVSSEEKSTVPPSKPKVDDDAVTNGDIGGVVMRSSTSGGLLQLSQGTRDAATSLFALSTIENGAANDELSRYAAFDKTYDPFLLPDDRAALPLKTPEDNSKPFVSSEDPPPSTRIILQSTK